MSLTEELAAALGSDRHERTDDRRGYRNGTLERTLTTPEGTRTIMVPRGRVLTADGGTEEFHSRVLPPYARRTREVDAAILGCYLRRREQPPDEDRAETAVGRGAFVQERRIANRRPVESALRDLARARSLIGAVRRDLSRRVSPESPGSRSGSSRCPCSPRSA